MTVHIDLNADIGEAEDAAGIEAERAILRYVSSANIACGGHRGDDISMARTVAEARKNGVVIGAHPSYPDRVHFGRRSQTIGVDITAETLLQTLFAQIVRLCEIAADHDMRVAYVKPHGAVYNDAVRSRVHADLIAGVIARLDKTLIFMGAPHSEMTRAANDFGIPFIREGFIDRRYDNGGHLQPRSEDGAVISDNAARTDQALRLALHGQAVSASGKVLNLSPQSLCLHGDSDGAVMTAKQTRQSLEAAGVMIKPFAPMDYQHVITG